MNLSIFFISFFSIKSAGSKSFTSAAIGEGSSDGSNRVILPIPDFPPHRDCQVFSTPIPRGVTSPMPVTTTRLFKTTSSLLYSLLNSAQLLSFLHLHQVSRY